MASSPDSTGGVHSDMVLDGGDMVLDGGDILLEGRFGDDLGMMSTSAGTPVYVRGADGEPIVGPNGEPIDALKLCALAAAQQALINQAVYHLLMPKPRAPPISRDRADIQELLARLEREKLFRVTFRMERMAFNKLVRLLKPELRRNDYYGGERMSKLETVKL